MDDTKFIKLGNIYLKAMMDNKDITKMSDTARQIKIFIFNHPNNPNVYWFIRTILELHLTLFQDEALLKAFSLPDNLKYYKQMDIYRNLPYTKYQALPWYLSAVLDIPNGAYGKAYDSLLELLKKYLPFQASNPSLLAAKSFVDDNPQIAFAIKDDYKSIDEEIAQYHNAKSGKIFTDLKLFAFSKNEMDIEAIREEYINKKIGNIGEIYAYEMAMGAFEKVIFVAKEIKNGFGYDIIYLDDGTETLVEVKTTRNTSEDDSFKVSPNEYEKLKECLTRPNANYLICRIILDETLLNPSYIILSPLDEKALKDISNSGIEYHIDIREDGIYFVKRNPNRSKLPQ